MLDRGSVKFSVDLEPPDFRFNATHFISFQDASGRWIAEDFHGHDYRARLKITRELDDSGCVIDFVAAMNSFREVLEGWDHRVLLPKSPLCAARTDSETSVETVLEGEPQRKYVFPKTRVKDLDARNATTEETAFAILDEFAEKIGISSGLTLRLEEAPGCFVEVSAE